MSRKPKKPQHDLLSAGGGSWVALSSSGVIGKGLTAQDAVTAAKISRVKESVQVIYLPTDQSPPLELPPVFGRVREAVNDPSRVWLVGGAVRDSILHRPIHDLDFAVEGDSLAVARHVANKIGGAFFALDESRGIGRVVMNEGDERFVIDFAELRGDSLHEDLAARDFTINAMAVSLMPQTRLFDPMGGRDDLNAKMIRMCRPTSFVDDPIRALRAIRLAAQFSFHIDRATREAAREVESLLPRVSAERMRDEFMRILEGRKPAASIKALDLLGLLKHIIPEASAMKGVTQSLPHEYDVWTHTLSVIDKLEDLLSVLKPVHDIDAASELILGLAAVRVGRYRSQISDHLEKELSVGRSARGLLFLAAFLHDIAKPQTRTVEADTQRIRFLTHEDKGSEVARARAASLRLANDEIKRVAIIVSHHLRPAQLAQQGGVSPKAAYRFFRSTGNAGVDVCLLSLADTLGKGGVEVDQEDWLARINAVVTLLEANFDQQSEVIKPPPLISGDDVMRELNLQPSPRVGQILEAVREAQAAGEVKTKEEALKFVTEYATRNT